MTFVGLAPLKILPLPIELPAYDLVMVWHPLRDPTPPIAGCVIKSSKFPGTCVFSYLTLTTTLPFARPVST